MINLDEYYHSYLTDKEKKFCIDGVYESVVSYGYHCDGSDITGHYVLTDNYRLVSIRGFESHLFRYTMKHFVYK